MKPDFSKIAYQSPAPKAPPRNESQAWMTAERIPVKASYSAEDLSAMEHCKRRWSSTPSHSPSTQEPSPCARWSDMTDSS